MMSACCQLCDAAVELSQVELSISHPSCLHVCIYFFTQVAHHTESKFHLEEALSGVYDVSLLASWDDVGGSRSRAGGSFHGDVGEGALPGARDKGQADDTTDTVHITSKYGRRFECRVPRPAVTSHANDDDAEPAFDPVKVCTLTPIASITSISPLCYHKHMNG